MTDTGRVKEYIDLTRKKKMLKGELSLIEGELKAIEPEIFEEFIQQGVSGIKIGSRTVFLKKQVYVSPMPVENGDPDAAYERTCKALIDVGWGELVSPRFNANTLSAAVREILKEEGGKLPERLAATLKISERQKVGVSGV